MHQSVRSAIAKIEVVADSGKILSRGTGFLVDGDKVLTALHVIADRTATPPKILAGQIRLSFPGGQTSAEVLEKWYDPTADWALLVCHDAPAVEPIPMGVRHESGTAFETFGFPDANPRDGMLQTGTIEDDGANLAGAPAFQLFSKQAAAGDGAPVKGLSGAPVLVDGAVVGLLRFALMDGQRQTVAGTLYACPLASVLESTGEILPTPDPLHGLPGLPRRPLPASPFRYLEPFHEPDAELFFGRGREIARMVRLLTSEDGPAVVLFYGQSGVGKSSVLDAGVIPRLRRDYETFYVRRKESESLLDSARSALYPSPGEQTLAECWSKRQQADGKPLILIIDQVEEIFSSPLAGAGNELVELCAALRKLIDHELLGRSRVVLGFRKEWYPEVQKQFQLSDIGHGNVFLEGLDRDAVLEVFDGFQRSARLRDQYGIQVGEGLAEQVANDLAADRDSPVAPTLQVLLTKMWFEARKHSTDAPEFSLELYQRLRREGLLLGDFLEQQLLAISAIDPAAIESGLAVDVLNFHITPLITACERGYEEVKQAYTHLGPELDTTLDRLQDHYLLTRSQLVEGEARASTRLGHDTLAPLVRRMVGRSDRPGQRARRLLDNRSKEWRDGNEGTRLGSHDLGVIENGLRGTRDLDEDEKRMLAASAQLRRRKRRIRSMTIGVAVMALFAVVGAGFWALLEQGHAKRQAVLTELSRSTDQMFNLLSIEPVHALMISIAAAGKSYQLDDSVAPALQFSLSQAVDRTWETALLDNGNPVIAMALAPRGDRIASADDEGMIRIWAASGAAQEPERLFNSGQGRVNALAYFAGQQGVLATAGEDHTVRIWDSRDDVLKTVLSGHEGPVLAVAFDARGRTISAGEDGTIRRWGFDGEALGQPVEGHAGSPVTALAADIGRDVLVSGAGDGSVRIWRLSDGAPLTDPLGAHEDRVQDIAISRAEDVFASAASDGTVGLWQFDGTARGRQLKFGSSATSLAFRADGRALVIGSGDFLVHTVEVFIGEGLGDFLAPSFEGIDNAVSAILLTTDQDRIIVSSLDGTLRMGDWMSGQIDLPRHANAGMTQVSMNEAGERVTVSGVVDGAVQWQTWTDQAGVTGGRAGESLDTNAVRLAAVQDGTSLALGDHTSRILVQDIVSNKSWQIGVEEMGAISAVAFDEAGQTLAVAGNRALGLFDPAGDQPVTSTAIAGSPLIALGVGKGGRLVAGIDGRCLGVWKMGNEEASPGLRPLLVPGAQTEFCSSGQATLSAVAIDPDGKYLATGDSRGYIRIWARSGDKLEAIASFKGHNGTIGTLEFRPDARALLSGASSDRLKLWTFQGQRLAEFSVRGSRFLDVDFDARGDTVASIEADGTVRVWATHWAQWLETGCRRLENHVIFANPDANPNAKVAGWAEEARTVCREVLPGLSALEGAADSTRPD